MYHVFHSLGLLLQQNTISISFNVCGATVAASDGIVSEVMPYFTACFCFVNKLWTVSETSVWNIRKPRL